MFRVRRINADISGWDVMRFMFDGASAFNADISGWDVSSVTDMSAFNAHLGILRCVGDQRGPLGMERELGRTSG